MRAIALSFVLVMSGAVAGLACSSTTEDDVEAYVLDETDLELYGHRVEVQFGARIRGMVAFEGIDALVVQMTDDVAEVRRILT